jgi:hypothetical protein
MSNFLAVATVTATLRQMLLPVVGKDVPGATATTQRPDAAGGAQGLRVNLYLYQVTPNAALRNEDLPTRRTEGELVKHPQVALNLHYLLTFYGDEGNLEPQRLLGSVVRTLHTRPVLTSKMISDTIAAADPNLGLANSNLADQIELVRLRPISLSTEELSKLWSIFFQTPYNLSIAYEGDVVLIESEDTPHRALPVRQRNLNVVPFRQPVIEQIISQDQVIIAGSTLTIFGKNLRGDITRVRVGSIEVLLTQQDVTDTQISLSAPSGLYAGIQGIQVIHDMQIGTPPMPHRGVESNVAAFVLHPTIAASISNVQVIGNALRSADLTIQVNPTVGKAQRLVLLLNEVSSGVPASYTFIAAPRTADTNSITIHASSVKVAEYLVRVQVDGAESPLTVDTNSNNPSFNQYIGPKVTIP